MSDKYLNQAHIRRYWDNKNELLKLFGQSQSLLLRYSQTCEFWSSKDAFTIAFFAAVNHFNGPLRKQNFTLTGSKGHGLWFVIGGFRSVLCVSVFQGSLLVIVIMIDVSEKRSCEGGFEL